MSDKNVLSGKAQTSNVVFKPDSWLATMNFVKHLVLNNNVMIAILGEQGSGKTTFSHLLHEELGPQAPHMKSYRITASPLFNRVFFLQQLKDLLGSDGDASISNFIAMGLEQKSHILLIIDDAQYLSAVFIEELLGEVHQLGNNSYFHVCLVSDFSLVPTLNKLALNLYKDSIHSIELGALSENETKRYLLQKVMPRQNIEKRVTDERVKQFYQLTAGHLVDINRQMTGFFNSKHLPSRNKKVLRYVNIAAMALVATVVYIWHLQTTQSSPTISIEHTAQVSAPENNVLLSRVEPAPTLFSVVAPYEVGAVRQEILATPLRRSELIALNESDETTDESMVVMDKVIVAPKIMSHQEKPVVHPAPKIIKKNVTLTSPKANTSKPLLVKKGYTIQLLASQDKKKLEYFANLHHLRDKATLRRSNRPGSVWYVLTLGEYKLRKDATVAAHKLPKEMVQLNPWVRAISDLKLVG